ncbi:MerR family transcriptional regulator [Tardiphaga sp. 862_B3_N4_1]|uniref:MerR family transcriptional regulator n=1 Tax=Tardiphaga sp. 862_B3_N4_1 TaxID=3240764 RepID=UPI003F23372C
MRDDRRMSPEEILHEFGISPYVIKLWDKRGLLSPTQVGSRGNRYDGREVQMVRDREGFPRDPLLRPEPRPGPVESSLVPVETDQQPRRVMKVRGLGPLNLSAQIVAAKAAAGPDKGSIEQLNALLDDALRNLIGVDRQALSVELHQRREHKVAAFLGISVQRLQQICTLYDVHRPDEEYWATPPELRIVPIAPTNDYPFEGRLGPGVPISDDVE